MDAPTRNEPGVGELFGRLAEDGRTYVEAEIGFYKAVALRRIGMAKAGIVALVLAFLLINAALITLMLCVAAWIAIHLGPIIAGLIVFAAIGLISFFLIRFGLERLKLLAGDPEERAAIAAGERS